MTNNATAMTVANPATARVSATIVGEFLVSTEGVGRYIEHARQVSDTTGVFAGIVIAIAAGAGDQRAGQPDRTMGAALAVRRTGHGTVGGRQ